MSFEPDIFESLNMVFNFIIIDIMLCL